MTYIPQLSKGDLVTDAWGVQKVSLPYSVFHGMWTYDIPQSMWFMYENGTQVYTSTNVTSTGGAARLTANSSKSVVLLESRVCPRYQPNRGALFSTAGWFPNKTNNGIRDFGLFTTENGVFFRLKANGKLYAVLRSNSIETKEEEINTSGLPGFDVQKNNIYDIQFQWRSAGNYYFYIGDPTTGVSRLVHTFSLLGTLTSTSLENPALPIAYKATRTTQDVEMNIGCADYTSENGSMNILQYGSAYAANVTTTTDTPVIVIRNPLQVSGKTNTRNLTLARISFTCSKKSVFKVWMTRNPSDITGATYQTVNQGSFVDTDSPDMNPAAVRATAVTIANLRFVTAVPVEATFSREVTNPWPEEIIFPIVRGDYLIVTNTSASGTCDVVIEWGEAI